MIHSDFQSRIARSNFLTPRALAFFEMAGELCGEMLRSDPGNQTYREQLARVWYSRGQVLEKQNDPESAATMFHECYAVFSELAKEFPDNESYANAVTSLRKTLFPEEPPSVE